MKILVTGSREFVNVQMVGQAMLDVAYPIVDDNDEPIDLALWRSKQEETDAAGIVVMHGDCPTGADRIADTLAYWFEWEVYAYPADWNNLGKSAGPRRNQMMVNIAWRATQQGERVEVLAFFKKGALNKGTSDCVEKARKVGLPVMEYWSE